MKRVITILLVAAALAVTGCRRYKVIPDRTLGQIFHDAMLTNAYVDNQGVSIDSLNIYEPIFARYGYTTEDVRYTLEEFSRRKSAHLSDVAEYMILLFDREAAELNRQVAVLDTIDNVARRRATRTVLRDTMVRVSKAADTIRLRFVVDNVRTGDYVVSATYSLDSLDKGVGRRYRVYWICSDSTERIGFGGTVIKGGEHAIHHTLISKPGEPKAQLIIDFNHTGTRKGSTPPPRMTVEDIRVTYTPPTEQCVDALYDELKELERETGVRLPDSPTRRVGGEPIKAFARHAHIARLYSLDKAVTEDELDTYQKPKKEDFEGLLVSTDNQETFLNEMDRCFNRFATGLMDITPGLTKEDTVYCCLFRLEIRTMDIATLMSRTNSSVSKRRFRLELKLNGKDGC